MQSWQSIVVNDDTLEAHGRAGRVTSAMPYKGEGKEKDTDFVDVQLDQLPTEKVQPEPEAFAVKSLRAL